LDQIERYMKIAFLLGLGCPLLLAIGGCNREGQSPQTQGPTKQDIGAFPGQSAGLPAPPVSEWAKVKIDATGAVFVNKKQMASEEFSLDCARLKKSGGAIVLFVDSPNHAASPAQAEMIRKIADAGVPMKLAVDERELE